MGTEPEQSPAPGYTAPGHAAPGPAERVQRGQSRPTWAGWLALQRVWATRHDAVPAGSLHAWRIAFGLLIAFAMARAGVLGFVQRLWAEPAFHFRYWGLAWVPVPSGPWLWATVALTGLAGLVLAWGPRPRLAGLVVLLGFASLELIDEALYLNHYVFITAAAALGVLLGLPRRGQTHVVRWHVWALRAQVGLVYLLAGLAKLRFDWLFAAQPLRVWLDRALGMWGIDQVPYLPWMALAMAWAGLVFDTLVPFALLSRRLRPWAYAAVIAFHGITGLLFRIGVFPWAMIALVPVFFAPDWPAQLARRLRRPAQAGAAPVEPESLRGSPWLPRVVAAFVLVQLLMPLRAWAYPGLALWTEQGIRFGYQVMLYEKSAVAEFRIVEPGGRVRRVTGKDTLKTWQARAMANEPHMVLEYAHHLAAQDEAAGLPRPAVYADVFASVNGRPMQRLVDPTVDLAAETDTLLPKPWIVPLKPGGLAPFWRDPAFGFRRR